MAFYLKYRPQKFVDLVGQDHISQTLLSALKNGMESHAYLLTGPRGTGKTTTARLLAKAINCTNPKDAEPCDECDICREIKEGRALDIVEIDAASHTGVDDVRELIGQARIAPGKAKKKVYIIDEVHMLSKSAFNALLKTLEEPPGHVVFILATTEVHKLPATILSRVQRYDFRRVSKEEIKQNLKKIAQAEKIEIDDGSLDLIAIAAAGGHRDSISLFEQVAAFSNKVSVPDVVNVLGLSQSEEVFRLIETIFNGVPEEGLKIVQAVYESGADIAQLNSEIIESLREILLARIAGKPMHEDTEENKKKVVGLATKLEVDQIRTVLQEFIDKGRLIKEVSNPLLPLEMAIVATCGDKSEIIKPEFEINSNIQNPNPEIIGSYSKPKRGEDEKSGNSQKKHDPVPQVYRDGGGMKSNETVEPLNNKQPEAALAPVLEMTADIWQKITALAKVENASLFALLRDAKPMNITNSRLSIGVRFKFHKDKISEVKNRNILEKILRDVTGSDYQILCELIGAKGAKKEAKAASDDELQAAVAEVFEVEG